MGIGTTIGVIGGSLAAGGSIGGAAISAHGAGEAAKTMQTAGGQAAQNVQQATQGATGALSDYTSQAISGYFPYQMVGQGATSTLGQMMQPGGYLGTGWTGQFTAPTQEQAEATPGYQFALQQGLGALQSSAAARGTQLNTGTMKNMMGYGVGLANQTYNDVYSRQMQQYLTNQNTFLTNQQNMYNRLMGLSGVGQWATGNIGNLNAALGQNIAGTTMQGAQLYNQAKLGAASAAAQGQMNQGNIWGNALSNAGNQAGQYAMLGAMMGQQRGPAPIDLTANTSGYPVMPVYSPTGGIAGAGIGAQLPNFYGGGGATAPLNTYMSTPISSSLSMYGGG